MIIEDFGFYARLFHASLIRENRLAAGVYTLAERGEPKDKFRQLCELRMEKVARQCTPQNAAVLAGYEGLIETTNEYKDFVSGAIEAA